MEGAGNDFIVIDNRFFRFGDDELADLARNLCTRRTGIGADGLLALHPAEAADADFRMIYRNADGSVGTMCGNGARCIAAFARTAGIDKAEMTFETEAGSYRTEVADDLTSVRLWMPPPFPALSADQTVVEIDGSVVKVHRIWAGTHHAVTFVGDLDGTDVVRTGSRLRRHAEFAPSGVNVNFVEDACRDEGDGMSVRARTYEKGVEAETLACGTGAIAIAIAAVGSGRVGGDTVHVDMPGGRLTVGIEHDGRAVRSLYLEGPVRQVFRGTFDLE